MQITVRYASQSSVYRLNKNLKGKPGVEAVLLRTFFTAIKVTSITVTPAS